MRFAAFFMGMLSVGSGGCVGGWLAPTPVEWMFIETENNDRKKHDAIQIVAISTEPNGATTKFECTFRKSGKCVGLSSESALELPAGIHEECLARLQDSEFFQLESNEPRWVPFAKAQKPVSSIEVHFRDQKHMVKQYANLEAEEGYSKFKQFLDDVRKRGTVIDPMAGPNRLNRSLDQLGGIVSGLTPAGVLTPEISIPVRNNRD